MSASDAERRVKSSERQDKMSVSDKTRNCTEKPVANETSIFRSIIDFDVKITSKAALCTNKGALLGFLRPVMIFLEWSCHGLPWIVGPILGILISHEGGLIEILMNLLLGECAGLCIMMTKIPLSAVNLLGEVYYQIIVVPGKSVSKFLFSNNSNVKNMREYRVTMAEELRNLPIQGDYVTPPP